MSFTHLHVHSGFSFLYWGQGTKTGQIYFPSPMVTKSKKKRGPARPSGQRNCRQGEPMSGFVLVAIK